MNGYKELTKHTNGGSENIVFPESDDGSISLKSEQTKYKAMAEALDIKDKKERNWVRVAYGFKFLKNGLASFIDQQVQKQHVDLKHLFENDSSNPATNCALCSSESLLPEHKTRQCIQKSRSKCFCFTWQNRRKCPNQFCSRFYDNIVFAHSEANPSWQNTDPTRWYSEYWELAKCFLGTTGYLTIHSASETDVTGLLSIAINDLFVVNVIDNLDNFKQARINRNEIFHRKMLEVTDDEVAMYIDRMIDVLQDKPHLLRDVECQKAVNQLNKLKQNQLYISTVDAEELRNEALVAIKATTEQSKSEIKETTMMSIRELKLEAREIKEELRDTANTLSCQIKMAVDDKKGVKNKEEDEREKNKRNEQPVENTLAYDQGFNVYSNPNVSGCDNSDSEQSRTITQDDEDRLRLKLVRFYRDRHSTIPMSPLVIEDIVPLEEFYVQPPMTAIDLRHPFGNPSKTSVTSYQQLFFNDDGSTYKHIYVTADAGVGKTCFIKHICMTWCQATDQVTSPVKTFKPEDIAATKYFDFLFLVTLRDADMSKCNLDDMIIASLQTDFDRECLNRILTDRSCLIILDGLDEWTHPSTCTRPHKENDVPHSNYRTNWTILTTLRPWKFDVIRPASNQIDRHIEIDHLDEKSTNQLVINAVNLLNNRSANKPRKTAKDFLRTISLINLGEVRRIPYIYLQCVCLWFDEKEIGDSKCKVYSNIIELTLNRGTMKIQSGSPTVSHQLESKVTTPKCLLEKQNCMQHLPLLLKLGKLAFYALFDEENKQRLVLDITFVRKYLDLAELDYCLKLGLLSQNKVYGHVSQRLSNVAFQHKSVQEFFAAFYIQANVESTTAGRTKLQEIILQKCTSLSTILEVSNVLIFLSGFRPQAYSEISHKIKDVVSSEEITCNYREKTYTLTGDSYYEILLKYQTLQKDCTREMEVCGEEYEPLPLEDFLIYEDTNHEEYMSALQTIIHDNHGSLKSLSIKRCQTTEEVTQILETLDLHNIHSLDKLLLWAVARQPDVEQLLTQSMDTLRCLSLRCMNFKQGIYYDKMTVLSERCEETILSMPLLQALYLDSLSLTHSQLNKVTSFLTSRVTMTEIRIDFIVCSDHKVCRGVVLDMSRHVNLQSIGLNRVPVSQLHVNAEHLEECVIGELSSSVTAHCFTSLQAAQHLKTLELTRLDDVALSSIITILPALLRLEQLYIRFTDLGNRSIRLSNEMTKLEYISLHKVSMASSCLRDLTKTLGKLGQSVTVQLYRCTVTPESDYKTVIQELKKSETFTVIQDGSNVYGHSVFKFQTVK